MSPRLLALPRRVRDHVGRRGACLLLFGAVFGMYGLRLAVDDRERPGPMWLTMYVPLDVLGVVWVVVGLVAAVHAFRRGPGDDMLGFYFMTGLSLGWSAVHAWAWVLFLTPGGLAGSPLGWSDALTWTATTALVLVVAGWSEAPSGYAPDVVNGDPSGVA